MREIKMSVSPRPWKCVDGGINVYDVNGRHIFEVTGDDMCADDEDMDECRDNTAHIVKCVNMHEELVAALESLERAGITAVFDSPERMAARDVLEKAKRKN